MLIKEYRIPMPLSVEEYKVAQRFMIAKKSMNDSSHDGGGIEILENYPYEQGPGGNGQYTKKIYHVGNRLPNWIKSIMPKDALVVYEEAWNGYPYTLTKFSIPAAEKFEIEIESFFKPDDGTAHDNLFNLKRSELSKREVDFVDLCENIGQKVEPNEDITKFQSKKSGRGPLKPGWRKEKHSSMMCAYKLCKVNFQYWGLQSKIEHFIHDSGLRKTLLDAHKQCWIWQDEWIGLTMNDVLNMELEVQKKLASIYGHNDEFSIPETSSTIAATKSLRCLAQAHETDRNEKESQSAENYDDDSDDHSHTDVSEDEFLDALDDVYDCQYLSESQATVEPKKSTSTSTSSVDDSFLDAQEPSELQHLVFCCTGPPFIENDKEGNDFEIFKGTLDDVLLSHYSQAKGSLKFIPINCPSVLSPELLKGFACINAGQENVAHTVRNPNISLDTIALVACAGAYYEDNLQKCIIELNNSYADFIDENDNKFQGKCHIIATGMSSIVLFDILRKFAPKLLFKVENFFLLGSPLGLVLTQRKLWYPEQYTNSDEEENFAISKCAPACTEIFNIYQSFDPLAHRIEPCLNSFFESVHPFDVPYFHDFPYGLSDPPSVHPLLKEGLKVGHTVSGENGNMITNELVQDMISDDEKEVLWWGNSRIDVLLSAPRGELLTLPPLARFYAAQGSYLESREFASFLLRILVKTKTATANRMSKMGHFVADFTPREPVTKFLRKRNKLLTTGMDMKARHSARDSIVCSGSPINLSAKFVYGPAKNRLCGEEIDVHILSNASSAAVANWGFVGKTLTNEKGKIRYEIPQRELLSVGVYPVVFLVKGDHSVADSRLYIVPPKVSTVIFSIDGSFAASTSMTGVDPKLQARALDTARVWSSKGFFLLYVSSRLDIQQDNVLNWLARHSFPLGAVIFTGALHSEGPAQHKSHVLKNIMSDTQLEVHAAYGAHKDIPVFLTLDCENIFILAKREKSVIKKHSNVMYLPQGYTQEHIDSIKAVMADVPMPINQDISISARTTSLRRLSHNTSKRSEYLSKRRSVGELSHHASTNLHTRNSVGLSVQGLNSENTSASLENTKRSSYHSISNISSQTSNPGKQKSEKKWTNFVRKSTFSKEIRFSVSNGSSAGGGGGGGGGSNSADTTYYDEDKHS